MSRALRVQKLSDEFGQYILIVKCQACGHQRNAAPRTFGKVFGWDARLDEVARKLRCSKCGKKAGALKAVQPAKPRGYSSLPK